MTQKYTGGPAFPRSGVKDGYGRVVGDAAGMTLRDYFAARSEGLHEDATTGYAARFNDDPQPAVGDYLGWAKWSAKADARLRYINADAMIEARKETK